MTTAEIVSIEDAAIKIRTYWFKPEKPIKFIAGQFSQITIGHEKHDKRGDKRWFTLSSSPTEELISITTRLSDPPSSFKKSLINIKPGDKISVGEPMGDFVLPINKDTPLIFAAAGIGCTPFRSMVKYLQDKNQKRRIEMLYYVKSQSEVIFKDVFEAYDMKLSILEKNNISKKYADYIYEAAIKLPDGLIYVAGPEVMVDSIYYDLIDRQIKPSRIVTDYYHNYEAF